MFNKVVIYLSMFVILLVVLSGCQQKENGNDKDKESSSLIIAVIIPQYEEVIKKIYNKNHNYPIKVKSILQSPEELARHWNDLDVVIDDYLKSNKDVDLVYGFPPEYLNGLINKGHIKKLNNLIDDDLLKKLAPAILEPIKQAGKGDIYGVAPAFNNYVLAYNKNIFKEIGLKEPNNIMTWEEIITLTNKIQAKSNYTGIALGFPTSDQEFYYLFQNLSEPIENIENINGKAIINTHLNRKYWELFADIYKSNQKVTGEEFVKGNTAMAILPLGQLVDSEFLSFYGDYKKTDWGITGMPIFEENKGGLAYTDSIFSISKYSDNEEAVKFLEHVHGKEFAKMLTQSSIFPSYWDKDIKKMLLNKYGYDLTPAYIPPGALFNSPQFNGRKYNEIKSTGAKYFEKYLNGKESIDRILIDYQKTVNK